MVNQHYPVEAKMEGSINIVIKFNRVSNYNHLNEDEIYKRLSNSVKDIQEYLVDKISGEHRIETETLDDVDFSIEVKDFK